MTDKKLQVALDLFHVREALDILEEVGEYVDIIEVGTPLCVSEGAAAVREIKRAWPDKIVFADIKVMDGGGDVPKSVIEAGADMFSVLAATDDNTLSAARELATKTGTKLLVDMCNVTDMERRGVEVDAFEPDYVCCHVGYGLQGTGVDPIEELKRLSAVRAPKAIAGGIKADTFEQAVGSIAEDIIVGGGIVNAKDRAATAKWMRGVLDSANLTR